VVTSRTEVNDWCNELFFHEHIAQERKESNPDHERHRTAHDERLHHLRRNGNPLFRIEKRDELPKNPDEKDANDSTKEPHTNGVKKETAECSHLPSPLETIKVLSITYHIEKETARKCGKNENERSAQRGGAFSVTDGSYDAVGASRANSHDSKSADPEMVGKEVQ
jgi:hypothetical protein